MNSEVIDAIDATDLNEGLPALEDEKTKKTPFIFIIFIFVLFSITGLGVQYYINYSGMFSSDTVDLVEPEVPVIEPKDNDYEIDLGSNFKSPEPLPSDNLLVNSVNENTQSTVAIANPSAVDFEKSFKDLMYKLDSKFQEQSQVLQRIENNQIEISKQLSTGLNALADKDDDIVASIKQNERWLNGVSNQLKDIGVNVKEAAQEFPIVVYNRNRWGDDIYLTVAQKVKPDQTSFLRVGDIVGRWKLIDIKDKNAVFEHFDGAVKEVAL
ncbi:hypothetical protein G3489_19595 [Shewanella baltica]|uniref:hypothetical protein n=1 Tax=Shewanella baltica TaxID=62322 RepID=UPI00217EE801|nr:hypothetical protein [Shewanella baltica]MCS6271882.1 hypothetical protein [Shewanella baltica]